jgi:lipopolysaccharide heptosyltransferase II
VHALDRYRWFDRAFGPALCWAITQWLRLQAAARVRRDVRRILVIVLSEMGAVVLTQPMFARLRERYPSAEFYVLCSQQNVAAVDLLAAVRPDHVIAVRLGSVSMFARDALAAVRRLRALTIDVAIDLELFARISVVLAGLSGAPIRVGFDRYTQEGLYRGGIVNRPVLYNPHQHIAHQFVTLAEAIDSATVPSAKRLIDGAWPRLAPAGITAGEVDAARDALYRRHPATAGRPLVFLCPGPGLLPIRAWPIASFCGVARAFVDRGYAVAVLGVAADRARADEIRRACDRDTCIDLTGSTTSVRDVAVLLHLGALLITNDGGTGHVAALTPIPSIVLFGPETPMVYGSLSPGAVNVHKSLSCSPCLTAYNHRRSPCDGDNVCLKSITVEEVLAIAERAIAPSRS